MVVLTDGAAGIAALAPTARYADRAAQPARPLPGRQRRRLPRRPADRPRPRRGPGRGAAAGGRRRSRQRAGARTRPLRPPTWWPSAGTFGSGRRLTGQSRVQQVPDMLDVGVHLLDQRLHPACTSPGRAAGRRSRWRSRPRTARGRRGPARTPRPAARHRRRWGWCRPRSPPASAATECPAGSPSRRRPRRRVRPSPARRARWRWGSPSPARAGRRRTTTPVNRNTWSLSSRTRPKSPSATACRISVDELGWVPSVSSGTASTSKSPSPSSASVATIPAARKPNRKFSPTTIRDRVERPQHPVDELARGSTGRPRG